VKGLVERNVKADLGMWTISYTATGPDLNQANTAVVHDRQLVTAFASSRGFSAQDIEVQPTTVTDTFANRDNGREPSASERYLIKGGVKIRSGLVDKVRQASQDSGELVKEGVVLGENYPQAPQYFFTRLNDIRPAMLAEAT